MTKITLKFKQAVCSKCKLSTIKTTGKGRYTTTSYHCSARTAKIRKGVCNQFKG